MNLDRLNSVSMPAVAGSTFAIISSMQGVEQKTPEQRLAALACAFLLSARSMKVEPTRLFTLANNLIHGADGKQVPEFAGVARYLKEET